jgi:hypothetical protein
MGVYVQEFSKSLSLHESPVCFQIGYLGVSRRALPKSWRRSSSPLPYTGSVENGNLYRGHFSGGYRVDSPLGIVNSFASKTIYFV